MKAVALPARACAPRESIRGARWIASGGPPRSIAVVSIGRSRARNDHLAYRAYRDGRRSAVCGVLLPANGRIFALRGRERCRGVCGVRGSQLADTVGRASPPRPRLATGRTRRRNGAKSGAIAPRRSVGRSIRTDDSRGEPRASANNPGGARARRRIREITPCCPCARVPLGDA